MLRFGGGGGGGEVSSHDVEINAIAVAENLGGGGGGGGLINNLVGYFWY